MSDLSYKLAELRPALRPVAESAAWVASFVIANAISQEPVYFLILLLVLGSDVLDTSDKSKGLFRDFIAGSVTAVLALALNDQLGLAVGAVVALTAVARLLQKLA
ncbi:hypothetical protein E6H32_04550 [Candidatus Bathyarchaeota archaeon]|nr:MAG: hypothetical protein E6H32_04550 [Candidatus Bathyarchaeota archaeon]